MMTRNAILAAYSGPITLYYGDEFADDTRDAMGAQKDNIARTTGHLKARNEGEQRLHDYIANAMWMRSENPVMWKGTSEFTFYEPENGKALIVVKRDTESDNAVAIIFSDADGTVPVKELGESVSVKA